MTTIGRWLLGVCVALGGATGTPAWAKGHFLSSSVSVFEPRKEAQDFKLPDLNGNLVRLSDVRGRVVFLNFWATWCPPCQEEMPSMEELHRELRGAGLVMLTVNLGEGAEAVRTFMREQGLSFQVLLDSGTTAAYYGAYGIPVTYLIDRRGRVAARTIGSRDWTSEGSRSLIRSLLLE